MVSEFDHNSISDPVPPEKPEVQPWIKAAAQEIEDRAAYKYDCWAIIAKHYAAREVHCPSCSEAGGADMTVSHALPVCKPKPQPELPDGIALRKIIAREQSQPEALGVEDLTRRLQRWDETGGKSNPCLRSELVDRLEAAKVGKPEAREVAEQIAKAITSPTGPLTMSQTIEREVAPLVAQLERLHDEVGGRGNKLGVANEHITELEGALAIAKAAKDPGYWRVRAEKLEAELDTLREAMLVLLRKKDKQIENQRNTIRAVTAKLRDQEGLAAQLLEGKQSVQADLVSLRKEMGTANERIETQRKSIVKYHEELEELRKIRERFPDLGL